MCLNMQSSKYFAQEGIVMKLGKDYDKLIQICAYTYTYIHIYIYVYIYIRTHMWIQDEYLMKLVKEYDELINIYEYTYLYIYQYMYTLNTGRMCAEGGERV